MPRVWTAELIGDHTREQYTHEDFDVAREWLANTMDEAYGHARGCEALNVGLALAELRDALHEEDFSHQVGDDIVRVCGDWED